MSDRIPGSSYDNPVWYRGYRIYIGMFMPYDFAHDDYDGAPDAGDNRCGYGSSIEACKAEIDDIEEERAA